MEQLLLEEWWDKPRCLSTQQRGKQGEAWKNTDLWLNTGDRGYQMKPEWLLQSNKKQWFLTTEAAMHCNCLSQVAVSAKSLFENCVSLQMIMTDTETC